MSRAYVQYLQASMLPSMPPFTICPLPLQCTLHASLNPDGRVEVEGQGSQRCDAHPKSQASDSCRCPKRRRIAANGAVQDKDTVEQVETLDVSWKRSGACSSMYAGCLSAFISRLLLSSPVHPVPVHHPRQLQPLISTLRPAVSQPPAKTCVLPGLPETF